MPKNVPPELEDKFASCKQKVIAQGMDEDAAYGICYASVVEGKAEAIKAAAALGFVLDAPAAKVGNRNNRADRQAIRTIRARAAEIVEATRELEPTDEDEPEEAEASYMGAEVKALGDGKIAGYLVRYGGEDLEGDYFTKDTDFGEPDKLPVLYHHGMDGAIKRRRIGTAVLTRDDVGLWAEAQLNLRDEYERKIYELAQAGKLGWSSGAAAHAVEREMTGKAAHIKQWYLAEASLTPTPAEPRNVVAVKALPPAPALDEPAAPALTSDAAAGLGALVALEVVKALQNK